MRFRESGLWLGLGLVGWGFSAEAVGWRKERGGAGKEWEMRSRNKILHVRSSTHAKQARHFTRLQLLK